MTKLSKKEKKQASRALAAKLTRMGVKNEIQMIPSGKRIRRPILDDKGQLQTNEQGHVRMEIVDILRASNIFRNTVRTLRNGPPEQMMAFLNLPENNT